MASRSPRVRIKQVSADGAKINEIVAIIGDRETTMDVVRQGLLRQRIHVSPVWWPYLTERQRVVLKGKPRMSRAWVRMMKIMRDTDMTIEEFVETLSVEELVRGMPKNKNGHFQGRPPKFIPRAFHRACLNELMKRGRHLWEENYLKAIEAMTEIASGKGAGRHATPGERIKAAQFVIERMEGKIPERIHVTEDQPWMAVMDGIVAEVSPEAIERGRTALDSSRHSIAELNEEDIIEGEFEEGPIEFDDDPTPTPVRSTRRRK